MCSIECNICRLLGAEDAVIEAGGIVIRLVGLYHANRSVMQGVGTILLVYVML